MKIKILSILTISLFLISATITSKLPANSWWDVKNVTDELLISTYHPKESSLMGSKVSYYIDYTELVALDGKIEFGYTITVNDTTTFHTLASAVTLDHATDSVVYDNNGNYYFKYQINGSDTIWRVMAVSYLLPGDYPAIKYTKVSADSGKIEYKIQYNNK